MATEHLKRFEPYKAKKGDEYMNAKQLAHFRKILEAWKGELSQDIDTTIHSMQDEATADCGRRHSPGGNSGES